MPTPQDNGVANPGGVAASKGTKRNRLPSLLSSILPALAFWTCAAKLLLVCLLAVACTNGFLVLENVLWHSGKGVTRDVWNKSYGLYPDGRRPIYGAVGTENEGKILDDPATAGVDEAAVKKLPKDDTNYLKFHRFYAAGGVSVSEVQASKKDGNSGDIYQISSGNGPLYSLGNDFLRASGRVPGTLLFLILFACVSGDFTATEERTKGEGQGKGKSFLDRFSLTPFNRVVAMSCLGNVLCVTVAGSDLSTLFSNLHTFIWCIALPPIGLSFLPYLGHQRGKPLVEGARRGVPLRLLIATLKLGIYIFLATRLISVVLVEFLFPNFDAIKCVFTKMGIPEALVELGVISSITGLYIPFIFKCFGLAGNGHIHPVWEHHIPPTYEIGLGSTHTNITYMEPIGANMITFSAMVRSLMGRLFLLDASWLVLVAMAGKDFVYMVYQFVLRCDDRYLVLQIRHAKRRGLALLADEKTGNGNGMTAFLRGLLLGGEELAASGGSGKGDVEKGRGNNGHGANGAAPNGAAANGAAANGETAQKPDGAGGATARFWVSGTQKNAEAAGTKKPHDRSLSSMNDSFGRFLSEWIADYFDDALPTWIRHFVAERLRFPLDFTEEDLGLARSGFARWVEREKQESVVQEEIRSVFRNDALLGTDAVPQGGRGRGALSAGALCDAYGAMSGESAEQVPTLLRARGVRLTRRNSVRVDTRVLLGKSMSIQGGEDLNDSKHDGPVSRQARRQLCLLLNIPTRPKSLANPVSYLPGFGESLPRSLDLQHDLNVAFLVSGVVSTKLSHIPAIPDCDGAVGERHYECMVKVYRALQGGGGEARRMQRVTGGRRTGSALNSLFVGSYDQPVETSQWGFFISVWANGLLYAGETSHATWTQFGRNGPRALMAPSAPRGGPFKSAAAVYKVAEAEVGEQDAPEAERQDTFSRGVQWARPPLQIPGAEDVSLEAKDYAAADDFVGKHEFLGSISPKQLAALAPVVALCQCRIHRNFVNRGVSKLAMALTLLTMVTILCEVEVEVQDIGPEAGLATGDSSPTLPAGAAGVPSKGTIVKKGLQPMEYSHYTFGELSESRKSTWFWKCIFFLVVDVLELVFGLAEQYRRVHPRLRGFVNGLFEAGTARGVTLSFTFCLIWWSNCTTLQAIGGLLREETAETGGAAGEC